MTRLVEAFVSFETAMIPAMMDVSAIGVARWRKSVLMRVDGQWIKEPTDGQWQRWVAGRSLWVG